MLAFEFHSRSEGGKGVDQLVWPQVADTRARDAHEPRHANARQPLTLCAHSYSSYIARRRRRRCRVRASSRRGEWWRPCPSLKTTKKNQTRMIHHTCTQSLSDTTTPPPRRSRDDAQCNGFVRAPSRGGGKSPVDFFPSSFLCCIQYTLRFIHSRPTWFYGNNIATCYLY